MSGGLGRVVRGTDGRAASSRAGGEHTGGEHTSAGRRRVQTVVVTLTALLAVTASVLAVGLLVASSAPFRRAFEAQRGAHLIGQFDAAAVSAAQLAQTATVTGVTAGAGPFATVSLRPRTVSVKPAPGEPFALEPGLDLPPMTIVGRADAGGAVDQLVLTSGRWATAPGEIVLAAGGVPFTVGDKLSFPGAPGNPTVTVVGKARSIGASALAWVTPDQLTALTGPQTPVTYQMLYRFEHADTDADITADRSAIAAAVPAGALLGTTSYLTLKRDAERQAGTFAPFVVAFGVLGLAMSVLIISIVVGGAVSSGTRRIGILKALGYTPAQVARAYVAQALVPSAVGAAIGVVLGNLASVPVLAEEGDAFTTGAPRLAPWVSVVVPLGALLVVAATAAVPALRAGRLRTVDAIAVGRTPTVGRGRRARRILGRLPLSRPVSLGLANPFTRPARSATIAAAVALGALGVTFGIGLAASLSAIQAGLNLRNAGDVVVRHVTSVGPDGQIRVGPGAGRVGPGQTGSGPDPAIGSAIAHQPGTRRYFTTNEVQVSVSGLSDQTTAIGFDGDSSWGAYQILDGRWFSAPGEAVVPTAFLAATGLRVGDPLTLTDDGRTARLRIVGEVLDLSGDGRRVMTDAASLAGLGSTQGPVDYHIQVQPGTDLASYVDSLNATVRPLNAEAEVNTGEISSIVVAMDTLTGTLTLLLVAVAGLGVLNTVVLDTRERVHDLGVFKALGMSPRQTVAMVLTSVGATGLVAGVIGVPAGIAVHDWILPAMGRAAGTGVPAVDLHVYHPPMLVPLLFGGLVIAIAGALLPAGWAARTRTARALHTE
jgi:putative ABC transport system permease protein